MNMQTKEEQLQNLKKESFDHSTDTKSDPYEEVIRKLMEYEEGCPPITRQEYICGCSGCKDDDSEE